jgi:RNA polymerase sigma factor (sigma-70 family)
MTDDKRKARLKRWIDDYGRLVLGTALKILKNRQDAEDVFQNTFIKAYVKSAPFKSEEHLKAWLIRVAYNESISLLRSCWRKNAALSEIPETLCDEMGSGYDIADCVNRLPVPCRKTIYLYYFAGYSCNEIAAAEKVSPSAIRSRLERARAKLKAELERSNTYA